MTEINNIMRQHVIINENLKAMKSLICVNNISKDSEQIARIINRISSRIKNFLQTKEIPLYMNTIKSSNKGMVKFIEEYINGNSDANAYYERYINKFDTRLKIEKHMEDFRKDSIYILDILEARLQKEVELIRCFFKYRKDLTN
jgi:TnpA family transposase